MTNRFFQPASSFDPGILTDFKEKLRRPDGKRAAVLGVLTFFKQGLTCDKKKTFYRSTFCGAPPCGGSIKTVKPFY